MTVEKAYLIALLEKELDIISTHQGYDRKLGAKIADTHIEDGLHEMVDQLLYNRRLANTHLQRAEAILSTVYPDLGNREPGWLDAAALKQYIRKMRDEND